MGGAHVFVDGAVSDFLLGKLFQQIWGSDKEGQERQEEREWKQNTLSKKIQETLVAQIVACHRKLERVLQEINF